MGCCKKYSRYQRVQYTSLHNFLVNFLENMLLGKKGQQFFFLKEHYFKACSPRNYAGRCPAWPRWWPTDFYNVPCLKSLVCPLNMLIVIYPGISLLNGKIIGNLISILYEGIRCLKSSSNYVSEQSASEWKNFLIIFLRKKTKSTYYNLMNLIDY